MKKLYKLQMNGQGTELLVPANHKWSRAFIESSNQQKESKNNKSNTSQAKAGTRGASSL